MYYERYVHQPDNRNQRQGNPYWLLRGESPMFTYINSFPPTVPDTPALPGPEVRLDLSQDDVLMMAATEKAVEECGTNEGSEAMPNVTAPNPIVDAVSIVMAREPHQIPLLAETDDEMSNVHATSTTNKDKLGVTDNVAASEDRQNKQEGDLKGGYPRSTAQQVMGPGDMSSSTSTVKLLNLPHLKDDSTNYILYKERIPNPMEMTEINGDYYLLGNLTPLSDNKVEKQLTLQDAYDQKEAQVHEMIYKTISTSTFMQIKNEPTTAAMWKKLTSIFEEKGISTQENLLNKLQNQHCSDDGDI
ncbi:uncharacterized protein EV420DRAFT_1648375 [Desarmillaria tabescens]|uniref:Uncharacterized protein n=1 Tax=Armillaria tabescens TaxID=1929756 RepID=A0AA39JQK0_ARMTA|nr:uncharacterized protein EV420DRAFT_1648375 [Desarmillaria tabescens]KAK0445659.1 hypothetical protein EV420DRAFT_1648375 [Desarmillaria tabescens]